MSWISFCDLALSGKQIAHTNEVLNVLNQQESLSIRKDFALSTSSQTSAVDFKGLRCTSLRMHAAGMPVVWKSI